MNLSAVILTLLASFFLLRLARYWAPLPLLVGVTYMTLGQSIEVGPFHFTVIRILVAVGAARVLLKGERMMTGWTCLDWTMLAWGGWMIFSSCFHEDFATTLVNHLGLVYDTLGIYFLLRVLIEDLQGVLGLFKAVAILLVPIAIEMAAESVTGKNSFSFLGGIPPECEVRGGQIRAQGPFGHSILAGTVGAVCMPTALLFWRNRRTLAVLGLASSACMILTSRSSGPIMTTVFAIAAIFLWKYRHYMRLIRWGGLLSILLLNAVMQAPVYYLLARIDLTGSSTGWHRAALIESAFNHFGEWCVGGTDYTRHWMPTGVSWSENHTDITNQYIKMGVVGGFPAMCLFIGIMVCGFILVSRALRARQNDAPQEAFAIWTLGSILFAHAATMMSVSYFDQSAVFLYLLLAALGSLQACRAVERELAPEFQIDGVANR